MGAWCIYQGGDWMQFNPPTTTSWALQKICSTRDVLAQWIQRDTYRIAEVYKQFVPRGTRVFWYHFVWHRSAIPKERFIIWLALLQISVLILELLMMLIAPCVSLQLKVWTISFLVVSLALSVLLVCWSS